MPTDYPTSLCSGCGRPIVWGVTSPGKAVPLDPRPPVYHVTHDEKAKSGVSAIRLTDAFVSHFSTCNNADQFSASIRRNPNRKPRFRRPPPFDL